MHLQAALHGFLLQLQADGRSPHTIGQYRRHVAALIAWLAAHGNNQNVNDLSPDVLARFFADGAANQAISAATWRRYCPMVCGDRPSACSCKR
ncbi:MAG: site-specific integrase, partial [Planctomycetes bacterium]|nr:site-specific integrase [Planctomycetota bacterium]